MAESVTDETVAAGIETSLAEAFGGAKPAPKPASVPAPVEAAPEPVEALPVEDAEPTEIPDDELPPEVEAAPGPEPEFEIEVNGAKEIVRGAAQVKELLQKGADYSRKSEEVARARDQVAAQAQLVQLNQQFSQAVMGDVAELQALDKQLEAYNKVDWSALIDSNFTEAMKHQEKRQQLRDERGKMLQQLNQKQAQFQQGQAKAAQELQTAEMNSLLVKLPAWRNNETRISEDTAIRSYLANEGFREAEILGIVDHRAILVARKAMKYDALMRNKADAVKQVRTAPPVVKPGAVGQVNQARAQDGKFITEFRRAGAKGNHRAQEASLEKVLARTFK